MKERTLKEWFEYYEKHNKFPQGMNRHGNYPAGSCLFWDKDKGYIVLVRDTDNNMMVVDEMCGDIKYWIEFVRAQADKYGCDKVGAKTPRRIRPYLRRIGAEILKVITSDNGLSRYICKDKDNNLVTASEGRVVNKEVYCVSPIQMHAIVWYLNKKVEG